jgi:hypothetical protein
VLLFKPLTFALGFAAEKMSPVGDKLKNMARYRKNKSDPKEKIINILKIHLKK